MSKRSEPDDPTELSPTEASKKPRLDIQEQIERASALAAQLRDGVKDGTDSKTSAAHQIATEELLRIFENMQEKTVEYVIVDFYHPLLSDHKCSTSKSVDDLISAQIKLEVHRMMDFLASPAARLPSYLSIQINNVLKPTNLFFRGDIIQKVQELVETFTDEDYVTIIKRSVKTVLIREYRKGTGAELTSVLDSIL